MARLGDPRRIEGVSNPTDPDDHLYAEGALLPGPDAFLGGPTFETWLDSPAFAEWADSRSRAAQS